MPIKIFEQDIRAQPVNKLQAKSSQESEHLKMLEDARKQVFFYFY